MKTATPVTVVKHLRASTNGLTMLETAIAITAETNVPCLPSDLTNIFTNLERKGTIKREGKRQNPMLRGKRTARQAAIFKLV